MPFIGVLDGEKVIPEGVENGVDVYCPACDGRMHPWGPAKDGTARHFQHYARGRDCDAVGGESDLHRKMKSLAVSKLRNVFGDVAKRCVPEYKLGAPLTKDADHRKADAIVEFEDRDPQLGKGLIIEVQYKNKSKDIEATTEDYVAQDYSVAWVYENDFGNDQFLLNEVGMRSRAADSVWPDFLPKSVDWHTPRYDLSILVPWRRRKWDHLDPLLFAWKADLSKSVKVPATLPKDWFDDVSLEIWRNQLWGDLFPCTLYYSIESDHNVAHDYGYEHESCTWEVISDQDLGPIEKIEATLPREWYDKKSMEIWRERPWGDRFPGLEDPLVDSNGDPIEDLEGLDLSGQWETEVDIPFVKWLIDDGRESVYWSIIEAAHQKGLANSDGHFIKACPFCDTHELHDPIHRDEMKRFRNCRNCGESYTVFSAV